MINTTGATQRDSTQWAMVRQLKIHSLPDGEPRIGVLEGATLPIAVKRLYWITGCDPGEVRGNHAHKSLEQVLACVVGAFRVRLRTQSGEGLEVPLRPNEDALYVPPGLWRTYEALCPGSVLLVAASHPHDEQDYVRDWNQFASQQ